MQDAVAAAERHHAKSQLKPEPATLAAPTPSPADKKAKTKRGASGGGLSKEGESVIGGLFAGIDALADRVAAKTKAKTPTTPPNGKQAKKPATKTKKAELISLGNLSEGLGRAAHRREVEAKAMRPARKRRRGPKRA
jgi:hypothetical protein